MLQQVEKELDDFEVDWPVDDVKKFVIEKATRTVIEMAGNEVLENLVKRTDKTNLIKASRRKINEAALHK